MIHGYSLFFWCLIFFIILNSCCCSFQVSSHNTFKNDGNDIILMALGFVCAPDNLYFRNRARSAIKQMNIPNIVTRLY